MGGDAAKSRVPAFPLTDSAYEPERVGRSVKLGERLEGNKKMHVNALWVLLMMLGIFFVVQSGNRTALWITLFLVAGGTLFVAFTAAAAGSYGGLLGVAGLVLGFAIVYAIRKR